jgi:gliding motility-associated-like protein
MKQTFYFTIKLLYYLLARPKIYIFFCVSALFLWAFEGQAQEGTRQLMPTFADKLYIELYGAGNNFASYNSEERERLYVYLKAGEKMYFGMKMIDPSPTNQGDANVTTFRVMAPNGSTAFPQTAFPQTGQNGFIADYAQATTGPNGVKINGVPVAAGYTPLVYTATTTGNHYIQFETWTNSSFVTRARKRSWIEFFDVTVTDASDNTVLHTSNPNQGAIAGRIWSKQWALTNVSFTANPIKASFFIHTADGFVNRVKYDMSTFSYIFVSNTFGVKETADALENRKSEVDNAFNNDISEHQIFLNDPDHTIFPSSAVIPKVKIWFNNELIYDYDYPNVLFSNVATIPANISPDGCPNPIISEFKIESNIEGQLQVNLDIDGGGFNLEGGVDRVLYIKVEPNVTKYLTWDLKDLAGNNHPIGPTFNAQAVFLLAGVVHFPLFDVEKMNSVEAEGIRPYSNFAPTLYWDDTNLKNPPSSLTLSPTTNVTQLIPGNPSNFVRTWNYNGNNDAFNNGNKNTSNSWFSGLELVVGFKYSVNQIPLCENNDCDKDKIPNIIDIDDDNDGIPDVVEISGAIDPNADEDSDNLLNFQDPDVAGYVDSNSDGVNDNFDKDLDGVINSCDLDSDNDGIMDVIEAGGNDPDLNGIINNIIITDIDKDGLDDSVDPDIFGGTPGTPLPNPNTDNDLIFNFLDIDSDNDGIPDNREGQSTSGYKAPSTVANFDSDKDGLNDAYDNFFNQNNTVAPFGTYGSIIAGGTPITPVNTDTQDQADYIEQDSDNDLAKDWIEGFDDNENGSTLEDLLIRSAVYETLNGNPGHYANADADNDGLPNWLEDQDNDQIPNFLDSDNATFYRDTDKDGLIDLYDINNNGKGYGQATASFAEPDNDNDNAPNYRDPQTIVCLQAPSTAFTGITTVCVGDNIVLTAAENNATNYTWKKGGQIIGSTKVLTINNVTVSNAGNDYTLEVNNGGCNAVSGNFTLNVVPAPDLTFSGSATLCEGEKLQLTANQPNALSYTWKKGGTTISTERILSIDNVSTINISSDYTLEINNGVCIKISNTFAVNVVSKPQITMTVSASNPTICINSSANIIVANSEADVTYQLRINTTNIGTALNGNGGNLLLPTGSLTNPGINTFNVVATRSGCGSAELNNQAQVTVLDLPKLDLDIEASTNALCINNNGTNITIKNAESGVSYQLRIGTTNIGNAQLGNNNDLILPTGAINSLGITTFNILATRGVCTPAQLNETVAINVNGLPNLNLAVSPEVAMVCLNTNGTKIRIENSETDVTYQLQLNNNLIGVALNGNGNTLELATTTLNVPGIYTYSVVATRSGCATAELAQKAQIEVMNDPSPTLTVLVENNSLCVGNTGTNLVVRNSEVGASYQLYLNDIAIGNVFAGNGGNLNLPTGAITQTGINNFVVKARRGNCDWISLNNTVGISVFSNFSPTIDLSSNRPNNQFCAGEPGVFTANVSNAGNNPTLEWRVNGQIVQGNGNTLTINNLKEGDEISVTVNPNLPCSNSVTSPLIKVKVNPAPNVQISADALEGVAGCVINLSASGAQTYTWTPLTDVLNLTVSGDKITVRLQASTQFIVTGTDANGCSAKDTLEIKILPKEEVFVPSLFTPNNDNNNDVFLVHAECIADINVKVFDRAGNLVYEATTVEQATKIGWDGNHNGKPQPNGMYLWQIEGKCSNGLPLLFQGKNKGKINLFR